MKIKENKDTGAVKVIAETPKGATISKVLTVSHAERLLSLPKNGGWKLSNDSKYELKNNKLIAKK